MMKSLTIVLLVLSTSLFAQRYYNWDKTELFAIRMNRAVALSKDSIFIYTDDGDFYRSFDGGEGWQQILSSIPDYFATYLNVVNKRIFITKRVDTFTGKLFFTDDFGGTVQEVSNPTNKIFKEIQSFSQGLLGCDYFNAEIHLSTDNGGSWSYYATMPFYSDNFRASEDGDLYCQVDNKILRFNPDSNEWIAINTPVDIQEFAVFNDSLIVYSDRMIYSTNKGLNWTESDTLSAPEEFIYGKNGKIYGILRYHYSGPSKIGLFEISFNPFRLIQIGSFREGPSWGNEYENGLTLFQPYTIHSRLEERTPEFGEDYFPLFPGSKYFYFESSRHFSGPNYFNLKTNTVVEDTLVNGRMFYSIDEDSDYIYHWDPVDNRLYTYTETGGVEEYISFNYTDYYCQPLVDDLTGKKTLSPMWEEEITIQGEICNLNTISQELPDRYDTRFISYLEHIGIYKVRDDPNFQRSYTKQLVQALVYVSQNAYRVFDIVKDPEIRNISASLVNDTTAEFSFYVRHDYTGTGDSGSVNFIRELSFEYYYDNNGVLTEKDTIIVQPDHLVSDRTYFQFQLKLDSTKIRQKKCFLRYQIIAETEGLFPHYSTRQEAINIPVSMNDELVTYNYSLSAGYPNPFNPSTKMEFTLPKESDVRISIYNVTGEELFTATAGNYKAGRHEVNINMIDYSSGVYFVRMIAGEKVFTQKIMLLK